MNSTKEIIIDLVKDLPEEKINSVIDFIRFIKIQPTELDDYDYELAREADKALNDGEKPIPIEEACKLLGVDFDKL